MKSYCNRFSSHFEQDLFFGMGCFWPWSLHTQTELFGQRSKWRQKCLLAISLTGGFVCLVLEGLGWIVPMVDNWKKWVAVNSLSVYLLQKQDLPMMVWSLKLYWFTVSEPKNMGHILLWKINGRVRIIWEKCFGARNIVVCRCQFSGRMICSWKAIKKPFSPKCLPFVVYFLIFLASSVCLDKSWQI